MQRGRHESLLNKGGEPVASEETALSEDIVAVGQAPTGAIRRLTFDIDAALHKRIRMACLERGNDMAEELRRILQENFPDARASLQALAVERGVTQRQLLTEARQTRCRVITPSGTRAAGNPRLAFPALDNAERQAARDAGRFGVVTV
jgi:hypothetical protein